MTSPDGLSYPVNVSPVKIYEGRYGTEHNATMLRMGLLPYDCPQITGRNAGDPGGEGVILPL